MNNIKNWPEKPLPMKDVAQCIAALAHDEGLEAGKKFVMQIENLSRNDTEQLGSYNVVVERVR